VAEKSSPFVDGIAAERASKPVLRALTGVRTFAAFWVLLLHMQVVIGALVPEPYAAVTAFFGRPGFLGVDVFFVLSGFIISYNYAETFDRGITPGRWSRFLWARLARIYPVHFALLVALALAVFGLGFGWEGEIEAKRWSITGLVQSLVLVHAWVGAEDVWNPVSWSISSEWLAYLAFPVLSLLALAITQRVNGMSVWIVITAVAALPAIRDTLDNRLLDLPSMLPLQILSEFTAGCMIYRIFHGTTTVPAAARSPAAHMVLLITAGSILGIAELPARWTLLVVPPMILGLAHQLGWLAQALARPWVVYWGNVSFSLYMTHYLWLWAMQTFLPLASLQGYSAPARLVFVLVYLLPTLVIAAATYHLIEEPARRRMARLVHRPGSTPATFDSGNSLVVTGAAVPTK
jgi:peptidoglycan/LPS O-acetylase OafA/YrhL